ncbi:uncharacterized protein Osi22 [Diabrotica undecimpunctata]|uniref:uncharacterized protein Osi22 n=1 Tax=Diabrotica undecimpunctata TaxID=50387 RepID=UPI003B633179
MGPKSRLVVLIAFFSYFLSTIGASLSGNVTNTFNITDDSEALVSSTQIKEDISTVAPKSSNLIQIQPKLVHKAAIHKLEVIKKANKPNNVSKILASKKQIVQKFKKTNVAAKPISAIPSKKTLSVRIQKVTRKPIKSAQQIVKGNIGTISGDNSSGGHGSKRKRKRRKNCNKNVKEEKGFMEKMLPMMVTPFLISSSMVPMMLVSMFFTMIKSAFLGKIGLILMLINMFTSRRNPGAVSTHNLNMNHPNNQVAMAHYGWHGDEEYGAYVNRKR